MDRENEKKVVTEICEISETYDYSNPDSLDSVLAQIKDRDLFKESVFGKRYIQRLTMLGTGLEATDCVLCGSEALNRVVCNTCMQKIGELQRKRRQVEKQDVVIQKKQAPQVVQDSGINDNVSEVQPTIAPRSDSDNMSSDISIEELFKDMDDSLLQLASQVTAKTIKRLSWINIALSVVNFIMIFFLALFLWKYITAT